MDARRFDDLVRDLGGGGASRRRVLAGAGLGLAAALGLGGRAGAGGTGTCRAAFAADPGSIVGKNACGITACGTGRGCFCVQTIGHHPMCLVGFNPTLGRDHCPTEDRCDGHRDCRRGDVCAKVEGCCGRAHNRCLRPCPG